MRRSEESIAQIQRFARESEIALQQQADAADERALQFAMQLELDARSLDVYPVAQALSDGGGLHHVLRRAGGCHKQFCCG
jgi:hypothetical protein